MRRDAASQRQVDAADPQQSTWLSANAGSGKTRVLTDRVARLLLEGVEPERILCLTYTKAAASEMQNRLFARLGAWAMMDAEVLRSELSEMGFEGRIDDNGVAEARRLFARAIETPGGLKILTIHSFCAGLLRRFPLEAQVSPQFSEIEERASELLRAEVVDAMAEGPERPLVEAMARHYTGADFGKFLAEISAHSDAFEQEVSETQVRNALGVAADASIDAIFHDVIGPGDEAMLGRVREACAAGSANDVKTLPDLDLIVSNGIGIGDLPLLESRLLTGASAKEPFTAKVGKFPTAGTRARLGDDAQALDDLMVRVAAARPARLAILAARRTAALHSFATPFIRRYAAAKQARGWLDFDDLILKARTLLTDTRVADWVLWRLDGGIDHILVDEAQDTSPAQWQVIVNLTEEFTSGRGADPDRIRTLFVVGDKKQSIYSFQGAEPAEFDRLEADFGKKLAAVDAPFTSLTLDHSFRSSGAILEAVDRVFALDHMDGFRPQSSHLAFFDDLPGRVDLWPVTEKQEEDDPPDWFDPVERISPRDINVLLAEQIADEMRRIIDYETIPDRTKDLGLHRRKPHEGDFLVLVQGRGKLFDEIIRACKTTGLAIAGADVLKVAAELAVRDIVAVLSFLALPEDDLSLAAALRSPLFGWSEAELHALAQPREKGTYLWTALRKAALSHPETLSILNDLRLQADYLRPHDLIERLLTVHGGRERLLARLGEEARDGMDALLSQALSYERSAVPSLTGFLVWLEDDELKIKRQVEGAGRQIRVMTVHGAKGLEAPIVILPDTMKKRSDLRQSLLPGEPMTFWKPASDDGVELLDDLQADLKKKQAEERQRLLYVAMTRAEKWLIVCGAGGEGNSIGQIGKEPGSSWYGDISAAMADLGATEVLENGRNFTRYESAGWDALPLEELTAVSAPSVTLPNWALSAAPVPERDLGPLAPSDLGGSKSLGGDGDAETEGEALTYGTRLHLLLEHLSGGNRDEIDQRGRRILEALSEPPTQEEQALLLADVNRILRDETVAALFARDALIEVDVTAELPELNGARIGGAIDRLIVTDSRVTAIDYKTNRTVPDTPQAVPDGILRQMGAYLSAVKQIYPDREIEIAILWTATPEIMFLPHDLVVDHLSRASSVDLRQGDT